jgi:Xaa-Pro dipeptidase
MVNQAYGKYGIADFPVSEHKKRISKVQKLMQERNIDCLVLTSESNIGYFCGYRGSASVETVEYSSAFLILPVDGTPILVTYVSSRGNVDAMLAVGRAEYVYWDALKVLSKQNHSTKILEVVSKAVRESVPNPRSIGLELGQRLHIAVSLEVIDELRRVFGKSKFVDAGEIVWQCRKIKSSLEVEYLAKSSEITCAAFQNAFSKTRAGMTEKEVAREVYKGMLNGGGEDMPLKMFLNIRAGPERYTMCDTRPTERRLRKGDVLILDGGFRYRGYFSDITRLLCIGNPSEKQREMFEAAREAEELGVREMKAGTSGGKIWDIVMDNIKQGGNVKYSLFEGIGHGIGLDIHEPPRIASNSSDILESGMVMTMEPCLYDEPVVSGIVSGKKKLGEGVFFVEDEVLITSGGNRLISKMSRELYVVV